MNQSRELLVLTFEPLTHDPVPPLKLQARTGTWTSSIPIGCIAVLEGNRKGLVLRHRGDTVIVKYPDGSIEPVSEGAILQTEPSELVKAIHAIGWYPVPLPRDVYDQVIQSWEEGEDNGLC